MILWRMLLWVQWTRIHLKICHLFFILYSSEDMPFLFQSVFISSTCACMQLFLLSFNSFWPSDAIWQYRSGSTLAQVIACCLTTPSYYVDLSSKVLCGSWDNFTKAYELNPWHLLEDHTLKSRPHLPGSKELSTNVTVWCPLISGWCKDTTAQNSTVYSKDSHKIVLVYIKERLKMYILKWEN